jgi:Fic-DOC domain mobile mystery protein B
MEYPEGATPLDPDEMDGLKFSHVTTRGELDHLEQANIQDGLRWLTRHKGKDILNDQFARKLHSQLFGAVWKWAGQYRNTEKNIGVDPIQISTKLRELLDDVQYWVEHETYDPKEAAVRFHHRLVYIHPFPNGNGRHARFYADALLEKVYGTDWIDWSGGYDLQQMNVRRNQYINALRAADAGNYDPLFDFAGVEQ